LEHYPNILGLMSINANILFSYRVFGSERLKY